MPEQRKYKLTGEDMERALELEPKIEESLILARKMIELERRALAEGEEQNKMHFYLQPTKSWEEFIGSKDAEIIEEARKIYLSISSHGSYAHSFVRSYINEGEYASSEKMIHEKQEKEVLPETLGERMFFEKLKRNPKGKLKLGIKKGCILITCDLQEDADSFFGKSDKSRAGFFRVNQEFIKKEKYFKANVAVVVLEYSGKEEENIANHEIRHFYNQKIYRNSHEQADVGNALAISAKDELLALLVEERPIENIRKTLERTRKFGHRCFLEKESNNKDADEVLDRVEKVLQFVNEEGLLKENHEELVSLLNRVPFKNIPEWITAYALREKRNSGKIRLP